MSQRPRKVAFEFFFSAEATVDPKICPSVSVGKIDPKAGDRCASRGVQEGEEENSSWINGGNFHKGP